MHFIIRELKMLTRNWKVMIIVIIFLTLVAPFRFHIVLSSILILRHFCFQNLILIVLTIWYHFLNFQLSFSTVPIIIIFPQYSFVIQIIIFHFHFLIHLIYIQCFQYVILTIIQFLYAFWLRLQDFKWVLHILKAILPFEKWKSLTYQIFNFQKYLLNEKPHVHLYYYWYTYREYDCYLILKGFIFGLSLLTPLSCWEVYP